MYRALDKVDGSPETPQAVQRREHQQMFVLLGDPAFRLPAIDHEIELRNHVDLLPGITQRGVTHFYHYFLYILMSFNFYHENQTPRSQRIQNFEELEEHPKLKITSRIIFELKLFYLSLNLSPLMQDYIKKRKKERLVN